MPVRELDRTRSVYTHTRKLVRESGPVRLLVRAFLASSLLAVAQERQDTQQKQLDHLYNIIIQKLGRFLTSIGYRLNQNSRSIPSSIKHSIARLINVAPLEGCTVGWNRSLVELDVGSVA